MEKVRGESSSALDTRFSFHAMLFSLHELEPKKVVMTKIPQNKVLFIFGQMTCETLETLRFHLKAYPDTTIFWVTDEGDYKACIEFDDVLAHEAFHLIAKENQEQSAFFCATQGVDLDFSKVVLHEDDNLERYSSEFINHFILLHYLLAEKHGTRFLLDHVFKNLNDQSLHLSIRGAKGSYKGQVAVIIGAGSSLDDHLDLVKSLSKQAVIIACGSAQAICHDHGIKTDFAICTCPNLDSFDRLNQKLSSDVFITSLRCNSLLFKSFKGPKIVLPFCLQTGLSQLTSSLGGLDIFENVPHESSTAVSLGLIVAEFLGFETCVLIGVDLGFKTRQYALGIESTWLMQRFMPEVKALEKIASQSCMKIYQKGHDRFISGIDAISDELLQKLISRNQKLNRDQSSKLFKPHEFNRKVYLQELKKSLEICQNFVDHPFFEVMVEDQLAYQELLKQTCSKDDIKDLLGLLASLEESSDSILEV